MKNIKKILGVFLFVCLLMFSATNVKAKTVTATTVEDFMKYVQRQEKDVTEIVLGADISLQDLVVEDEEDDDAQLQIIVEDGLTIDLNGHTIELKNEYGSIGIAYGVKIQDYSYCNTGTLTIKDSSEGKTGKIDNIIMILMLNMGKEISNNTAEQSYNLVIDGGNYIKTGKANSQYAPLDSLFYLTEVNKNAWHNNVEFNFEINDGTFEIYENEELATGALFGGIIEMSRTLNTDPKLDIDLNFKKLMLKSKNGLLAKNNHYTLDYKINDIIPNTSALYIGNTTLNKEMKINDRTISAIEAIPSSVYSNTMESYEYMKVEEAKYNLTTSVSGTGGTISSSVNNILPNTKKTIIFTPNTGFMVDKVLVNNVETKVTNNKLELAMNEDKNVVVTYKKIPFTITVKDTNNATITPNGVVNVSYGDDQEFVISAKSGYKIVKVLVDGQSRELVNDTLTISNITKNLEVEVIVEKIVYKFLEGANQTYTISKDKELRFRIDADYSVFNNLVYVDGKLVDRNNYTSESGSTIIVLKQSYLDTLKVGEHTFKVEFSDGAEVETKFIIAQLEKEEANPKTSDNILLYVVTGIISLVGLSTIGIYIYRKKQNI